MFSLGPLEFYKALDKIFYDILTVRMWAGNLEKSVAEVSPKKAENDFKCPTPSGLNIDVISTGKRCQPQMPRRKELFTKIPLSTTT